MWRCLVARFFCRFSWDIIVNSKNRESEKMLKLAVGNGALRLEPISADMVAKSQGNMRFKKNSYVVRSFRFDFSDERFLSTTQFFPSINLLM